jgi:hypothetical protein
VNQELSGSKFQDEKNFLITQLKVLGILLNMLSAILELDG